MAPASGCRPAPTGSSARGGKTYPFVFAYGQNVDAQPKIPRKITVGKPQTVSGRGSDDNPYRLVATQLGPGEVAVVAVPLTEAFETLNRLVLVEGLVIVGILLVIAAVAWVVVRNSLLPLDRIGHTAGRIAGGDLSHRVEATDERTEVGRVGVALNRMLDRLEQAFSERQASEDRLRQFIADASHELRTPLASIRGYAELHRMGAARSDEDVEKAMRRIEDEAARMGVLVEDLLTLARLDQIADAPHADVDLAHLAEDAAQDARATAPDRAIELHADGAAIVRGDAHQLRQVLGNLVRNALVHTPAGTPDRRRRRPRPGRRHAHRPRPRPRPPHRRPGRAVRALLARRGRARARQVRRRARARDRGRDRRRPRRPRGRRQRRRRRRGVHGHAPRARSSQGRLREVGGRSHGRSRSWLA